MRTISTTTKNDQYQQVLSIAQQLHGTKPNWVTFFREVFGVDGLARRTFGNFGELVEFQQSTEYAQIQELLADLRGSRFPGSTDEATRVITVRLPESLHESLRIESHDLRTSINKLCLSKLVQAIDVELIPRRQSHPVDVT